MSSDKSQTHQDMNDKTSQNGNGRRHDQPDPDAIPAVPLHSLDALWFQVGGTICNLWCTHCFISCSPKNHKFGFMDRASVNRYLDQSKTHGVKEYYFTGGEPFMNKDMLGILEDTLAIGPATVLTNGILINRRLAEKLQWVVADSIYSLEIRLSVDGFTAERNDPIRGKGSFEKAMTGVKNLVDAGFLPIITAAQTWEDSDAETMFRGFRRSLIELGYSRPRIKIIPPLRIGREKVRSRGYDQYESITQEMMTDFDDHLLQCTHSRMVTDQGVYVCPILIDYPDAKVAETLDESFDPYPLRHQACYTCYRSGAICHNFSAQSDLN
jgi:sulfatase maturation enzyme AslB (radical SAM superfamily)